MSDSVVLDINDQVNWDDQGKPLMQSNGAVGPPANHRLLGSTSSKTLPSTSQSSKYPEFPRVFLSYLYMFIFGFANSYVVIIVHDWTPDRKQYLPLPDLILNNVPYLPWAFHACEALAGVLLVIFFILMSVHKHRWVILRRLFVIYGSVLLMRCPAMLLTSLTIPNNELQCDPMMNDTMWSKFQRAGDLYMKFGLSTQGVKTCGDYMFSGHTVFLSLLNYVITEYSTFVLLHVFTWCVTLVAMAFIVLGKAHYSIDVVIAFFITSLYFNYYHTLTSHHDPNVTESSPPSSWFKRLCFVRQRLRVWVPFYNYLERGTGGIPLPNEYESPLTAIMRFVRGVRHRVLVGKSRLI